MNLIGYNELKPRVYSYKEKNVKIQNHKELQAWQLAMDSAMHIYVATKKFPPEEKYSLVDQIRRSSRSVAANITEA